MYTTGMMASRAVQEAIRQNAVALGTQLMRHGGNIALVQDVLHSMTKWASQSQTRLTAQRMVQSTKEPSVVKHAADLSGAQLDAACATLKLLSTRLVALRDMASEPCSNSISDPGMLIQTKSWLLPFMPSKRQHWQYGYEVRFTNTSDEPLQLVRKAWQVTEMSGAHYSRTSMGLLGLQPIIAGGESRAFHTAISLGSIKGSMKGHFLMRSSVTGAMYTATVAPFALTPTAEQYNDQRYIPGELVNPTTAQLVSTNTAQSVRNTSPLSPVENRHASAQVTAVRHSNIPTAVASSCTHVTQRVSRAEEQVVMFNKWIEQQLRAKQEPAFVLAM